MTLWSDYLIKISFSSLIVIKEIFCCCRCSCSSSYYYYCCYRVLFIIVLLKNNSSLRNSNDFSSFCTKGSVFCFVLRKNFKKSLRRISSFLLFAILLLLLLKKKQINKISIATKLHEWAWDFFYVKWHRHCFLSFQSYFQ